MRKSWWSRAPLVPVCLLLVAGLLLPGHTLAQAPASGTFPAAPYRTMQLSYALQGVRLTSCVDAGGANGAATNPLRNCTGTLTGQRLDLRVSGTATAKEIAFAMNVDAEFTYAPTSIHAGTKPNRLSEGRQRGPATFPFDGGIDVPADVSQVDLRIFLFESGVMHGVMLTASLQRPTTPDVTASYRLGYDVPVNLIDDAPQAAPPLQLTFSSQTPNALITKVWLDSQVVGNPAVNQALGSYFLFDSSAASGFPKTYTVEPPETQVVWPLDTINLWSLSAGALPLEVVFGVRVELSTGETVPLEIPVRIDAAYTLAVLKEPAATAPTPDRIACDPWTLLDGRQLPARTTLKGQSDQTIRLPAGGAVLLRFLDGTAGVIALAPGDVCYTDFSPGFTGRRFEEPTNELVMKIGLDKLKDRAKDQLKDAVLKILLRRAAGPVGLIVDIFDQIDDSPADARKFVQVRLRSAVGLTIDAAGAVTVQGFEGEPAVVQPDGSDMLVPPGQAVARDPESGEYQPVAALPVGSSAAWLGLDETAQAPAPPEPTRVPTAAAAPTPIPTAAPTPTPPAPAPTPVPTAPARSGVIFTNSNDAAVLNGPPNPTTFSLASPQTVTLVMTYHWNSGRGTPQPGVIGLMDGTGKVYGPWAATGRPGQGNVPNAYWEAHPNVTLPAGGYTVLDSDNATWSYNGLSGGRGIVRVEGYPAALGPPAR